MNSLRDIERKRIAIGGNHGGYNGMFLRLVSLHSWVPYSGPMQAVKLPVSYTLNMDISKVGEGY
jgi:hypothetical protein